MSFYVGWYFELTFLCYCTKDWFLYSCCWFLFCLCLWSIALKVVCYWVFLFLFLLLLMRKILLLPTWYVVLIVIIRGSKYATEYDWPSVDDIHYLGISRLKKVGSMHGSIFMQHCWMVLLWIFYCFHCLWVFGLFRKHL
jgi:hypothetical protein